MLVSEVMSLLFDTFKITLNLLKNKNLQQYFIVCFILTLSAFLRFILGLCTVVVSGIFSPFLLLDTHVKE